MADTIQLPPDKYKIRQDQALVRLGLDPAMITEEERRTIPELQFFRDIYVMLPEAEAVPTTTEFVDATRASQRAVVEEANELVEQRGIQGRPITYEEAVKTVTPPPAPLQTADPYSTERSAPTGVIPVETRQILRVAPSMLASVQKQVSTAGADPTGVTNRDGTTRAQTARLTPQTLDDVKMSASDRAKAKAAQAAIEADPQLQLLDDEGLAQALGSISYEAFMAGVPGAAITYAQSPEAASKTMGEGGALDIQVKQGNAIPLLSPGAAAFRKTYRIEATEEQKRFYQSQGMDEATAYIQAQRDVEGELGKPEFWEDPAKAMEAAKAPPTFEGFAGVGVDVYPTGATVESDSAYVFRMMAAPANAIVGGVAGALGYFVPEYQQQRETSAFGAAGAADQTSGLTQSVKAGAAGNVAANRGVAEESYDLTATYTDNRYLRGAAFGLGLLGDFAMPAIPGSKTIGKGVKAIGAVTDVAGVLPPALKIGDALDVTQAASKVDALYEVRAMLRSSMPVDLDVVKRSAATVLGDAGADVVKTLDKAEDVQAARKIIDDAIGTTTTTQRVMDAERALSAFESTSPLARVPSVSRAVIRWTDDALAASPQLQARLKGMDLSTPVERARAVLKADKRLVLAHARAEAISDSISDVILKRSPGEATRLTTRTWALTPADAKAILQDARQSWVSDALTRPLTPASRESLSAWVKGRIDRMPEAESAPVRRALSELMDAPDLSNTARRVIQSEVIDAVARRQPGGRVRSIDSWAVERASESVQTELLKPVPVRRGYVARFLAEQARKVTGDWGRARGGATPQARQVYDQVAQAVGQLDRTVSAEVRRLSTDASARAQYGVPPGVQLDEREAMITMMFSHPPTLRPGQTRQVTTMEDVADTIEDLAVWREKAFFDLKSYTQTVCSRPTTAQFPVQARLSEGAKERFIQVASGLPPHRGDEALDSYLSELRTIWSGVPGIVTVKAGDTERLISGAVFNLEAGKVHQRALADLAPALPADLADVAPTLVAQVVFRRLGEAVGSSVSASWAALRDERTFDALESLRASDPARYDRALLVADDLATAWISELRLVEANADELISRLEQIIKAPSGRNVLDKTARDMIVDSVKTNRTMDAAAEVVRNDQTIATWLAACMDTLTSTQYALMLTFRTRFHGPNWITAPAIMVQTIGGRETVEALKAYDRGAMLAAYVSRPLNLQGGLSDSVKRMQTAVTDPAGRTYSWDELATIAREGGITRSVTGTAASEAQIKNGALIVKDARAIPRKLASNAIDLGQSIAEWSDTSFRASVLIKSLEAGEDVSVAIRKARESLYDYGKITDWEKENIQRWFAFYSFTRASTVSTVEALLSNPTRLKNVVVATKGLNLYGDSEEQRSWFYDKEYMRSRPILAIYEGVDKARYAEYAPPLPPADGILFILKVLKAASTGQGSEFTVERATPTLTVILGLDDQSRKMVLEQGYIDPRHVAWLQATGAWSTFEALVPGIQSSPARTGESSWNGRTYSLRDDGGSVNEVGAQTYWRMIQAMTLLGATGIINDYAPLTAELQPEGFISGIDMKTSIPELSGAVTQTRLSTPQEISASKRRSLQRNTQTKAPR